MRGPSVDQRSTATLTRRYASQTLWVSRACRTFWTLWTLWTLWRLWTLWTLLPITVAERHLTVAMGFSPWGNAI